MRYHPPSTSRPPPDHHCQPPTAYHPTITTHHLQGTSLLDPTDVGVLNQTVLSAQALMNRAPEAARQASSLVEAAAVAARPLLYSCLTAPTEGSETFAIGADADTDADTNTPATSESMSSHVTLGSGHSMPRLGFGTCWIAGGEDVYRATRAALRAGYRHIDGEPRLV